MPVKKRKKRPCPNAKNHNCSPCPLCGKELHELDDPDRSNYCLCCRRVLDPYGSAVVDYEYDEHAPLGFDVETMREGVVEDDRAERD